MMPDEKLAFYSLLMVLNMGAKVEEKQWDGGLAEESQGCPASLMSPRASEGLLMYLNQDTNVCEAHRHTRYPCVCL